MTPPSPPARHGTGTDKLLVDVAGAVAVVTINNPGKRNALSSEIRAALPGLLDTLQADIRIASDDSQFGIPAARLGLGPGFASVMTLVDLVGPAWASEILFSARRFPAAEALRMGLVNRVVPAADLRGEVMSLARGIAQNAPLTVAACKAAIREAGRSPDRRDLARVEAMIEACFASEDYREGRRAFAEKRPPAFTGH